MILQVSCDRKSNTFWDFVFGIVLPSIMNVLMAKIMHVQDAMHLEIEQVNCVLKHKFASINCFLRNNNILDWDFLAIF